MPEKDEEREHSTLAKYLRYSYVGIQFFLSVGLFTAGGIWLDRRLGTVVLFTLVGLALGFAGGLYTLYREVFLGRDPGERDPADKGKKGNRTRDSSHTRSPQSKND